MAVKKGPKRQGPRGRSDAGFTLVSLIVALVLLSVGLLSVSRVFTQAIAMQSVLDLRTTALDIARSYMEDVKGRGALGLTSESPVRVDESGTEDVNGIFIRELQVQSVDRHLLEVKVIVTAPRSDPIELVTLMWDGIW